MAKLGLNKVMLIGNLGQDPEVRALDMGAKVANLNIATTDSYLDKSGARQERTEWHRVVLWRGLADTAERYLKKGSTIFIEGRLVTKSWDGEDGKKNYRTEVEADRMIMLDSKGGGEFSGGGGSAFPAQENSRPIQQTQGNPAVNAGSDTHQDDLPF